MELIADGGSTKTEWILLDGKKVKERFVTNGFNPNYSDIQDFENMVSYLKTQCMAPLQAIHYYGTGCGLERNCQLIKEVLERHFPVAAITVTHDLMAACHALLGHEKGMVCILGTGSNSCVYDGENITEKAVSLGYLVGDEGSGMHIGREVVKSYFYGFMPVELKKQFEVTYHLDLKCFIHKLYHEEQPSRYLASFARFAGEYQSNPFIRDLVKHCFDDFIKAYIFHFENCKTLKISFIGSIAYHFRDLLKEALETSGLMLGGVMGSPAEGLVHFYAK